MAKYSKLIMAAIGLGLLVAKDLMGFELPVDQNQIYNIAVAIMTALGVWGVPNATPPSA